MNSLVDHLDHLVLTTRDIVKCLDFYTRVLGMTVEPFGAGRIALKYGQQKINVDETSRTFGPLPDQPTPGSLDLCFIGAFPLDRVVAHLKKEGAEIELGPVPRTGAIYGLTSIYLRDPDGNLIEISERAGDGSTI